jgi:hypothetical protein
MSGLAAAGAPAVADLPAAESGRPADDPGLLPAPSRRLWPVPPVVPSVCPPPINRGCDGCTCCGCTPRGRPAEDAGRGACCACTCGTAPFETCPQGDTNSTHFWVSLSEAIMQDTTKCGLSRGAVAHGERWRRGACCLCTVSATHLRRLVSCRLATAVESAAAAARLFVSLGAGLLVAHCVCSVCVCSLHGVCCKEGEGRTMGTSAHTSHSPSSANTVLCFTPYTGAETCPPPVLFFQLFFSLPPKNI